MQFEEFIKRMPKLSNLTLLGQEAQFLMAPDERIRALKDVDIEAKNPRWAGVMAVKLQKNVNASVII